jgi:hypothetical protein
LEAIHGPVTGDWQPPVSEVEVEAEEPSLIEDVIEDVDHAVERVTRS